MKMKINKIVVFIITIIFVMSFNTSYADMKEPSQKASASKISAWINEGNDVSEVSVKKLATWYNTLAEASKYSEVIKVEKALEGKSCAEVEQWVNDNEDNLESTNTSVLAIFENILNNSKRPSDKLTTTVKTKKGEILADPTENPDSYVVRSTFFFKN